MNIIQIAREFMKALLRKDITFRTIRMLGRAFLRGTFYILWYALTRRNVSIRFPFMAYAPVRIIGKGSVFIDEKCSTFINMLEGLTIVTLSPQAKVTIGKSCDLGGTTIRCKNSITIGHRVMTASCLIQDVTLLNNKNGNGVCIGPSSLNGSDITIGDHVWLCAMSTVLGGTVIGNDSVLSVGSCLRGTTIPVYTFLAGNPVRRPIQIDKLLKLKGIL